MQLTFTCPSGPLLIGTVQKCNITIKREFPNITAVILMHQHNQPEPYAKIQIELSVKLPIECTINFNFMIKTKTRF